MVKALPSRSSRVDDHQRWSDTACGPGRLRATRSGNWLKLREDATKKLGKRFDIREFLPALALAPGAVPLAVLAQFVNEWVASKQV